MAAGDVKLVYGSEVALTITLASLANSATRAAGRESTAVVNTANLFLDCLLGGVITTAASVNSGTIIEVWLYGQYEDTPAYPGGVTGSDATLTPATPQGTYLKLAASITIDSTSSKAYYFGPVSVAAFFGGNLPPRWGVYVTQSTNQALHTTGHGIYYQPVYANVAAA